MFPTHMKKAFLFPWIHFFYSKTSSSLPHFFTFMLCFHHYLIFYIFYKPLSYSTFIIFLHLIISLFFFFPI
ncbi:hypothetical protein RchiOBHm_Chr1g0376101 [Rosa chinensis]|uniref:Uncharacterized protein n=1 Tax=Rosa chinensis TaxID=74649 RepID=A0A2P6SMR8_ROSCH|nr:hypothetical protein RchiOBHm_Chr1g0376101 [Rosa chinensis]